ncbi:MAG: hypothetical protein IJK62_00190 [Bacteroidales bacterium]|nr:hypothetical protein [Bacteroidales bacterium]
MKTSTKIIIGVAALATLGVGGFLIYRSVKKKKAAAEIPQDNTFTPTATYTPAETPSATEPSPVAPAPSASKPTSTATTSTGSGATNVQTSKGTSSVGFSFDKSAKTVTVNAMGIGTQKFKLSNVAAVQQFLMNLSAEAKAEMGAHGGADGKLGNYTAKWFAALVTQYAQGGISMQAQLTSVLSQLGVTTVK